MLNKLDKVLLNIIKGIVLILIISMFITVITGVITRYILKNPIFGTDELARYLMLYMVMFGSAIAFRNKTHPALLFVVERFSERFVQMWNVLIDMIIIIILTFILKEGYTIAVKNVIQKTPALRISSFWIYIALPIGAFIMIFQIIMSHIFKENQLKTENTLK